MIQVIVSYVHAVIYFWAYCPFQFCVSNSEDPHTKISKIEEETCDVKPTQLTVRLDPIKMRAGET